MQLSDIPKKTEQFWYALGEALCNHIRKRVQVEHKNANEQPFAPYSREYAERKAENKAKPRGMSQQSTSTIPDMTLTGKTMSGLQTFEVSKDHVVIGWIGLGAAVIEGLARRKNYRVVNVNSLTPFSKDEMDLIMKYAEKDADKKIEEYCRVPETIKVGA